MKKRFKELLKLGKLNEALDILPKTQPFAILVGRIKRNNANKYKGLISQDDYEDEWHECSQLLGELLDKEYALNTNT